MTSGSSKHRVIVIGWLECMPVWFTARFDVTMTSIGHITSGGTVKLVRHVVLWKVLVSISRTLVVRLGMLLINVRHFVRVENRVLGHSVI